MQNLARPALLVGLYLMAVLAPVLPWTGSMSHDAVRLAQLLAGLALLSGLAFASLRGNACTAAPPSLALLCLLLMGTASVVGAARSEVALRDFCLLLVGLLAVWPHERPSNLPTRHHRQIFVPLLVAGTAFYAALELLLIGSGLVLDHTLDYWQVFAGYVNPRFFNHVQTLLIPLLAGVIGLCGLRPLWRRLAWFALASNAFFLLLLMGRATGLALTVSSLLVLLLFGAFARAYVGRLLLGIAAGALLYMLLIKLLPTLINMEAVPVFRELGERGSVEARFYLWRLALDMIHAHPLLGVGPMHYADHFNGEAAHPHNIYLQIAAEYGLPFFSLLGFLVLRWLIRTTRTLRTHLRQTGDPLALACYAAVTGALVDGGFSGNFVMPLPQLWIVITLMLLNGRLPPPASGVAPVRPHAIHTALWRGGLVMLFVAQFVGLLQAVSEFSQTPVRINGAAQHPDATHFSPRFWRDGWF